MLGDAGGEADRPAPAVGPQSDAVESNEDKAARVNAAREILNEQVRAGPTPGGCDHCDATTTLRVDPDEDWLFHQRVQHEDDCPELAARRAPSAAPGLDELRALWRRWADLDPEQAAAASADEQGVPPPELLAVAGGDVVLAWRAWRASQLAMLRELGQAARERQAEAARR